MIRNNLSQKSTIKMLSFFILFFLSFINAQLITMSGYVTAHQPGGIEFDLPGAHVNIEGTDVHAVSDSLGYYELSFLWNWNGPVTAECHADGFQPVSETFFPDSDHVEMDFLLSPQPVVDTTQLMGFVMQSECDECPIPGALITAYNVNSPSDEVFSTESAENGHYLLELPLVPEYGFLWSVTVTHPDFQMQSVELEIGPDGAVHHFFLALNEPGPVIGVYGYVFSPEQNDMMMPVPGALISVWPADSSDIVYTTETNQDGYYELEFGSGNYVLTCSKEGFLPFETSFWVGNVPVLLSITLQHEPIENNPVFSGIVMGAVGDMLPAYAPLPGAHVEVFGNDDPGVASVDTYTDEAGHFAFFVDDSLHGFPVFHEALVRVSSPGFETQEIWLDFFDWPVIHDFFLELTPPGDVYLSGHVSGGDPNDPTVIFPIADALVQIFGGFSGGLLAETHTDDDGYYQFGDVATAAYAIEISAEGFIPQEHPLPGYGGDYPIELDFTLLPDETQLPYIAGHVYRADSPDANLIIPGAFLQLRGFSNDEIIEETHSDDSGYYQFMFNGLFIDVSAFGYISQTVEVPQVDCAPGNNRCWPIDLDIYLQPDEVPPPTGIIFGMVSAQLSPMGPVFPVAGAQVSAAPLWGAPEWISTETDDNGEYSLEVWAGDIPWVVTCETEFGIHTEQVVVPPNGEITVNFHFNAWEEPVLPPPFDLIAEAGFDENGSHVVFLNWQYPPSPDPTIVPEFHIFLESGNSGEWIQVGATLETEFVFPIDDTLPGNTLCFAVNAQALGMVSEMSNTACTDLTEPGCFDLSGIDFGPCDMVLGAGWNGEECVWISGCSSEVDGVDYSPYFFDTMDECAVECETPEETGLVHGWVTVQFSQEGPTFPIPGAEVAASFPGGVDSLYTTMTNDDGSYEMVLPANNLGYNITCSTEYGTQTHTISLPPGAEVNVDFHWDTWQEPTVPAPFDLTAVNQPDQGVYGSVLLQWQYPPLPDPNHFPGFIVYGNFTDPDGGWSELGTTDDLSFTFYLADPWSSQEMCFAVSAILNGEESELSNVACTQPVEPGCFDLSGIDFGDCEMVLGIGWNGEECVLISGCSMVVDGVDYSPYFFETFDECDDVCGNEPPPETAVLYGTVNYIWGDAIELISGASIMAEGVNGLVYETISDDFGGYELQMIAGEYAVTCTLPDTGEAQTETVNLEAGDITVLDFWFGEFTEQYALFGMVFGETTSGEAVPLDGAHIIVFYSGMILDAFSDQGSYWINLPEPGEYQVEVNAEGYIGVEDVINVAGITEQDFLLQPLDSGMLIVHLNIGSAVAMPGDTVAIPIFAETEHPIGGIQFTLTDVPDLAYAVSYQSTMECFTASYNDVDGSAITIFFSPDGCTIEPGTHHFATLYYLLDNPAPPGETIMLIPENVVISNPDGEPMEYMTQSGSITLGMPGDVNMDGEINVLDIVNLVNFILLLDTPDDYEFFAGDINGDDVLNVLDVVQLVNIILGNPGRTSDGNYTSASIDTGDGIISIRGSRIAGFQLTTQPDIHLEGWNLPDGWSVRTAGNRLVAYTMGELIDGVAELYTSEPVSVQNALLSDQSGQAIPVTRRVLPETVRLVSNYPNPFNPVTTIRYELPETGRVSIVIYDMRGREVAQLVNAVEEAGYHSVKWDGSDRASGLYVVRLTTGGYTAVQKISLVK